MTTYYPTLALEIHAELKTDTKMFSAARNNPDETHPNVNIDPVSMAYPGTLPVINQKAVEHVIRVGLALNGTIANFTEFDRKNYFYPDIPKGYQISQYKYPIVSGGKLLGVDITRIHLEEDTANSKHGADGSLIDYNRAGVPLMELVTEPVMHTPEQAGAFGRELQLILQTIGASDANMEKGEMRVELNISISPDPNKIGTKVEVKNLNSFRSMERAAAYEIKRMTELYEDGKQDEIVQETRGWDEVKQVTFSQRKKENSHDYRYFPDPDLPKLYLHDLYNLDEIRSNLPELPEAKRVRYATDFGIKTEDIDTYLYDHELGVYFEKVANILSDKEKVKTASNYITSDYLGLKKSNANINLPSAENFAELIQMVSDGQVSSRAAKDILAMIVSTDESPMKIATEKDLIQKNDEGALKEMAQRVIDANPTVVATYKGGKENALMSLVGAIMKESKGSANPALVQKVLKEILGSTTTE
ncbi:MAG: Asp-tRNA(Asn)/Glu-tRNA(Gln) amidotransferase subunit GatB [Minisyncoccia bacterium]